MKLIAVITAFIISTLVPTGYKVGEKIESFSLTNATDSRAVSLDQYLNSKGVVLIFTSNDCPFARLYEEKIIALNKAYENKGVRFILVNAGTKNADSESVAAMAQRAREKGFSFPYLADPNLKTADMFGATKIPEAFVLESKNGSFILRYRGAIDDNPQATEGVASNYLKDAIAAIIGNSTIKVTEKKATGCVIKRN
jgi:peroxiredoxin